MIKLTIKTTPSQQLLDIWLNLFETTDTEVDLCNEIAEEIRLRRDAGDLELN